MIRSLTQEEDRLLRQYRKGHLPERLFEEHMKEIATDRKRLTGELERLAGAARVAAAAKQEVGRLSALLGELRGKLWNLPFAGRRELVTLIVPGGRTHRVTVNGKGLVEVVGRIGLRQARRARPRYEKQHIAGHALRIVTCCVVGTRRRAGAPAARRLLSEEVDVRVAAP